MLRTLIPTLTAGLLLSLTLSSVAAEQSITLNDGDYPIPAILHLPVAHNSSVPAVLLLHGTASQKNEVGDLFQRLAQQLGAAGIASLRIDFAGAGDSPVDHVLYSLSGAVTDAAQALRYLQGHGAIDPGALAVLGFSQGGLIAQRLVLQEPRVRALLTWSTVAIDGPGSFSRFFEQYYDEAVANGSVAVDFDWLPEPLNFSRQWFEELRTHTTFTQMRAFKSPILTIAGLADSTVPFVQSIELAKQSQHPQSRAVLLTGADHTFNVLAQPATGSGAPSSDRELLKLSTDWLTGILGAG